MAIDLGGRERMLRKAGSLIFALAIVAAPVPGATQSAVPRIGFLSASGSAAASPFVEGLRQGLRESGYVDGSQIAIEYRFADGKFDRLPELASELVRLRVQVIVATVTQASLAARNATNTIPIVMVAVADPVASGLVRSLARPGGNVTGTSSVSAETARKSLELLKEVVPNTRRVAVLWNPANRVFHMQVLRETEVAARLLGIELQMLEARNVESIETAFKAMSRDGVGALNVLPDPTLIDHAQRIAVLAGTGRVASVSGSLAFAEAGGLMAYGPSFYELSRGAARYVAKILNGAKPSDLPIEQPTKFEYVINLKTANQLGLTIPPSLLLRADRTIR